MIARDLKWLREQLQAGIDEAVNLGDDSVFVHSKIWEILNYDSTTATICVHNHAKKYKITLVVGQIPV